MDLTDLQLATKNLLPSRAELTSRVKLRARSLLLSKCPKLLSNLLLEKDLERLLELKKITETNLKSRILVKIVRNLNKKESKSEFKNVNLIDMINELDLITKMIMSIKRIVKSLKSSADLTPTSSTRKLRKDPRWLRESTSTTSSSTPGTRDPSTSSPELNHAEVEGLIIRVIMTR